MDLKQIQELVKIVNKSGISELQVKEGDFEVTIKTGTMVQMPVQQMPSMMQQMPSMMQHMATSGVPEAASDGRPDTPAQAEAAQAKADNLFTFRSPMIGTFYRKAGPDKPLFVQVGDSVKKGDVLCIIEAMKLFNEIEYDGDSGRIARILVDDSSPVEYDQPLFQIEKA